jgi:nitrate/nitrite transporter NarK
VLSGAAAVLAVVHPGFKIPAGVEGLVASLGTLSAVALQALHFVKKSTLDQNVALASAFATQLASTAKTDVAKETPAAPAAATPTA